MRRPRGKPLADLHVLRLSCRLLLTGLLLLSLVSPGLAEEDEWVLGVSAAFTGQSRGLGIELWRGSMAYFNFINSQGGVNGRKIRLQLYDDGYNPNPCIENTISLVEGDQVLALYNYVGTPTVTRVLPLIKYFKDKSVVLFFPFTGASPQRQPPYDDMVYNLRASYRQEIYGLVERMYLLTKRRFALFYQADAYGRSGWDGAQRALKAHGLELVGEATYHRGADFQTSMARQVEIIRQARPDAVISVGSYAACAAFIRDARDSGVEVPIANVSFVGSESMLSLLQQAGRQSGADYTENLINSQVVPSYEDYSLPGVREYRQLMAQWAPATPEGFSSEYEPLAYSFVSFEGFLNAKVMTEVLRRMGPVSARAAIRPAVESIKDFDIGIGVPVNFSPDQHQGLHVVYFTTVQNGKFVPFLDAKVFKP